MAYPAVTAPYGLKPINLIGGQVFSGSTRELPIQYGYATNLLYGDAVVLTNGFVTRATVTNGAAPNQVVGVFMGCMYTNPTTKQKLPAQYWPAGTLAGDATAVICDDPDTVFKAVVCSSGSNVASGSMALVGNNLSMVDNAGNVSVGNSTNAVLCPTATPVTTVLPLRCVGVVSDTAYSTSAVGSSTGAAITLTAGLLQAVPQGSGVGYVASNGQFVSTGRFVTAGAAQGATSLTLNSAVQVPGGITAIPAGSSIVFTSYPEILVKFNEGVHGYHSGTTA